MVLNYEVVGSARWEALKSYHHLGFAMLILFGLLLRSNQPANGLQSSFDEVRTQPSGIVGQS